jgi:hypothetical protein
MTDTLKARNASLECAYAFAKSGNGTWAQLWLNQANSYETVTKRQIAYAQRCLDKALKEQHEVQP